MSTIERGLFVTFEGLDGCGKSTQMRLFAAKLRNEGREVLETVEPGGTSIGEAIRSILLNKRNTHLSPTAELLLYFAARAQNVDERINPALQRGAIVISDRFTDSTLAYQGWGRELGEDVVLALDGVACRGRKPDLTFWIEIDRETSLARARLRNKEVSTDDTRMDEQSEAFYSRVHAAYERIAEHEPRRVQRVNGEGSIEEVAARVWAVWREAPAHRV
jgi:dTMP kinase